MNLGSRVIFNAALFAPDTQSITSPLHYSAVVVFEFCLVISVSTVFYHIFSTLHYLTVFLIFHSPYSTTFLMQCILSSFGFPDEEHLMNISTSGIKFKYIRQHSNFNKVPLSFPLQTLTSHSHRCLVPVQDNILITSHHFTNPCPFDFSSCCCALHKLSSHIVFENLMFRALESECCDILHEELGSWNAKVWVLDLPLPSLTVGKFLILPMP